MAEVIWTQQATDELHQIRTYLLSVTSQERAEAIADRLFERVEILEKFPRVGRTVRNSRRADDSLRELIEGSYRIVYELIDEDLILIQRLIHTSRDSEELD